MVGLLTIKDLSPDQNKKKIFHRDCGINSAELISRGTVFFLTVNQPQPAYKPKNSLPNRAHVITEKF
jgi:hypothetical protein